MHFRETFVSTYLFICLTVFFLLFSLCDVQVVDTELFSRLQEIHGKDYHSFAARKLVPVVGDVREANVGIAPELAGVIADEVDIIVNSAANTTFDERFCHSLNCSVAPKMSS